MEESRIIQELSGVPGSPYTRKMLALMRYRRIPYRLLPGGRHLVDPDLDRFPARAKAKVPLLPTFYMKNERGEEEAVCDSTPIIRRFEVEYNGRSVIPDDPRLAFIDYIIEDFADEWLTKAMFHYRWSYDADIEKAGQMLPRWNNTSAPEADIQEKSDYVSALQISRLSYVGSNDATRELIEHSFEEFVGLLDKHLSQRPFLFGKRPSAADFAIHGQLSCLALFDPTPQAYILANAPRIYAWAECMDDMSGYETQPGDWATLEQLGESLVQMLGMIGRLYAPYLLANAAAVAAGEETVQLRLDGHDWKQATFNYQAKCLQWIQGKYSELSEEHRNSLILLLKQTGIIDLIPDE